MRLHPNSIDAYQLLHDGTLALARAEEQGIRVDLKKLDKNIHHITKSVARLERKFKETDFYQQWDDSIEGTPNIYSPQQMGKFLYTVKGLSPAKLTATGAGSTDKEALQSLKQPALEILAQIKKLKKIRDTYLISFKREQANGYIHTSYNLHLVRTFRSSASNPNLQNIPKRDKEAMQYTRSALFPRPGHQLMEADYSGLEVRIAACYHKDKNMLKYINDPTSDMHGDMAKQIFKLPEFDTDDPDHDLLRSATKNGFVFPEFYGDYYKNCAVNMGNKWGGLPMSRWKAGQGVPLNGGTLSDHMIASGIKSMDGFTKHMREIEADFWEKRFKEYAKWKDRWYAQYQTRGFIEMKTGFTCSGEMRRNDVINYAVQGAAFHCLLWSFIRMDELLREKGFKTRLIGQIHDSIIFDIYPPELKEVMELTKKVTCEELPEAWSWIIVPLEVDFELCDVDASWAEKKKVKIGSF